ncbi:MULTISPECIES: HpcH/HpaI aldolase/citrate lyase family protein [Burkholderia]|uniref:HpcH/HpaI aldolase/citrate lyase family protein n=1 Tax=Burkholderia semiarida TaxID=2843303 RepID=A0ABW7KWM0_9BURK|nr:MULTISPECIES: CoA ester lyase [Burkholderia]KVE05361.1 citrate lyase [Burkholderia anthina]KVH11705.1 citrate lyase [Burkholderia anthina]KVH12420.1 citrate lyase [Burkholderia anthina]KVM83549.1 citrate lyase [Burkholderia anthina]KVX30072.1 citrate lyase [Burkholderia anthina]
MKPSATCRSYLYVPAHKTQVVEKAYASEADAIVLDLEDAVPASHKVDARKAAADILAGGPPKPTYVRVNPIGTPWCRDDVEAIALPALQALRLPKCDFPAHIQEVAGWLDALGSDAGIQILIESAYGVETAYQLATASPRLERIGLGESDLRADLRIGVDNFTLEVCRARCVVASRAAGLNGPIQTVYHTLGDLDGLKESTLRAKSMGFVGRFAIHPSQLPVINAVFTPSDEEIRAAERVLEAVDAADDQSSVFVLPDGRVVAPPLIANARVTLALATHLRRDGVAA